MTTSTNSNEESHQPMPPDNLVDGHKTTMKVPSRPIASNIKSSTTLYLEKKLHQQQLRGDTNNSTPSACFSNSPAEEPWKVGASVRSQAKAPKRESGSSTSTASSSISASTSTSGSMEQVTRLFAQQNLHDVPAERLNEIPPEERTAALQDLHGAGDIIEETPEFRIAKLREFDTEIATLSSSSEIAAPFHTALEQSPEYVKGLRIAFLRAEQWDPLQAAHRMIQHFVTKNRLFDGRPELLGRPLKLSDFEPGYDQLAIETGIFQLLRHRDSVGRAIITMNPLAAGFPSFPIDSLLRMMFWMGALAVELGEDVQRKGVIYLWYGVGHRFKGPVNSRGNQMFNIFPALPIRVTAIHACFDCPRLKMLLDFMGSTVESKYLVRWVSHYGSHLECRYNLMTFGIPPHILPIDIDGTIHIRDHQKLLESIRLKEEQMELDGMLSSSQTIQNDQETPTDESLFPMEEEIEQPSSKDIVMGRGNRSSKWPGNLRLKQLVEEHYEEYDRSSRLAKTGISKRIYDKLVQQGYRFVSPNSKKSTQNSSKWMLVDEHVARDRIGHTFRNLRNSKR